MQALPGLKIVSEKHVAERKAYNEKHGRKGSVAIAERERDHTGEFKSKDHPVLVGHANKVVTDKSALHHHNVKYGSSHFLNICYYTTIDDAIVSKKPTVYASMTDIRLQIKKQSYATFPGGLEPEYWKWRTAGLKKKSQECPYEIHPVWVLWPCKKTYPTMQDQLDVLGNPNARFVLLDIETAHKTCFMPMYAYLVSATTTYQKINNMLNKQNTCVQIVFEYGPKPSVPITKSYIEKMAETRDLGLDFSYALAFHLIGGLDYFVKHYNSRRLGVQV